MAHVASRYDTVVTAKAGDAVYRTELITSLSSGTGAGKTFAVLHFASKVTAQLAAAPGQGHRIRGGPT